MRCVVLAALLAVAVAVVAMAVAVAVVVMFLPMHVPGTMSDQAQVHVTGDARRQQQDAQKNCKELTDQASGPQGCRHLGLP